MFKISFCITCMNRLMHLKKTLPINIKNAFNDSENIEFILLDYNSTDGLSDWVKSTMIPEIENQKLKFFQTFEPESYHFSHSRNMAFTLATGDILVNIDADNFIGKGFAKLILDNMAEGFYMAVEEKQFGENNFKDALGRICVWKKDFLEIRGYDESMVGYGFDDADLKFRLKKNYLKLIPFSNPKFLKSIKHDNRNRVENESAYKNIVSIAVRHLNPFSSEVFFFFENKLYEKATITDNLFGGGFSEKIEVLSGLNQLIIEELSKGQWTQDGIYFRMDNHTQLSTNDTTLHWFYQADKEVLTELVYTFSTLKNKNKYINNSVNQRSLVNSEGFGKGEVVKNFKEKFIL